MALSPNLRGAAFMAVSMFGFTINDTISKSLTDEMNAGQLMFVRGAFATLFIVLLAWQQKALHGPRSWFQPLVLLRAFCELFATVAFLTALAHMPLANVSAVLQSLPLAVTMGAALVFGETVGWRRWLAILVGFVGVLVIVRPGFEGFSTYSLLALVSVAFCAVRDLATRQIPKDIPTLVPSVVTAAAVAACGGLLIVPMGGWSPMTGEEAFRLALAALMLIPGYIFIILAMRIGEVSFVAPFRYTALLWAIVLGYAALGEVPDIVMLAGSTLVVGSGLFSLYRERVRGRTRPIAETSREPMAPDGT
ncbi:MAG: DMT family transporter [Rhizobiaceae bacterium]|nr:DMT family transporter [Rhizobiaceae bacterium]